MKSQSYYSDINHFIQPCTLSPTFHFPAFSLLYVCQPSRQCLSIIQPSRQCLNIIHQSLNFAKWHEPEMCLTSSIHLTTKNVRLHSRNMDNVDVTDDCCPTLLIPGNIIRSILFLKHINTFKNILHFCYRHQFYLEKYVSLVCLSIISRSVMGNISFSCPGGLWNKKAFFGISATKDCPCHGVNLWHLDWITITVITEPNWQWQHILPTTEACQCKQCKVGTIGASHELVTFIYQQ